jgi:hypothetical protein
MNRLDRPLLLILVMQVLFLVMFGRQLQPQIRRPQLALMRGVHV